MSVENITYDDLDVVKDGDSAGKIDLADISMLLKQDNGSDFLRNVFESNNESITSRLDFIKNTLIASIDIKNLDLSNGSSDIYAIQIIGHIDNKNITIDGINGNQTRQVLNNSEYFGDNLSNNTSNNESKDNIDSIEKQNDLKDVLDKTINEVINSYLKDLNSNEGINLSSEGIYSNVLEIIDNLYKDLNYKSLYKKDIEILKNNFLVPKDKGISHIQFIIEEKVLNNNSESIDVNKDNIDGYLNVLSSTLGTLYDIGVNKTEEELRLYFENMKGIDGVNEIFEKYPDLDDSLFKILPSVIKSIPREQFMGSLHVFLENIKYDILVITESKNIDELKKSKMSMINDLSLFFLSILNKDSVDSFSTNIVNLELIKNNDLLNELFNLVNHQNLSPDDRYNIVTKLLKGVNLFSLENITDNDINDYINTLTGTLSSISSKLPKDEILSLINKMKGDTEGESDIIEHGNINYKELATFLWDNKGKIVSIMGEWVDSDSEDFKEFIIEVFQNETLTQSLNGLGEKIVEKLRDIAGIDLKNIILGIREDFLNYDIKLSSEEEKTKNDKLSTIEDDLIGMIGKSLEKDISDLVLNKLSSSNDNNLKKEEIINIGITNVKDVVNNNTELVFDYLNELGYKIDSNEDKNNILEIFNSVFDNPKFEQIVSDIVGNIGKSLEDKKDIRGELDNLINTTIKSSATNLLSDGVKNNIQELTIDTAYNDILGDKDSLKSIFNVVKTNLGSEISIPDDKLFEAGRIIKEHLTEDSFKNLIDGTDFANLDIKDLGEKLYNKIDNKVEFVNKLIDLGILDAACKVEIAGDKCYNNEGLSIENTKIAVDLLYETLDDGANDKEDSNVASLLNKILDKQGLSELLKLEILGKNIGENIVAFLNSIDKNKLTEILVSNNNTINNLIGNQTNEERVISITEISTDLLKGVNIDSFKDKFKAEELNSAEKIQLDLMDEVRDVANEKFELIESLASKGNDIYDIFNGDITLDKINVDEIKKYGESVFDLLNSIVSKIDKKYLEKNFKTPDGDGEKNEVINSFISSFLSENKWFVVKEGVRGVLGGFNSGKTLDNYFRDSKANRSNFGDSIQDFVINNNKKIIDEK